MVKNIRLHGLGTILMLTSLLQSCRSTDNSVDGTTNNGGNGNVRINLQSSEMNNDILKTASASSKTVESTIKKTIIPIDGVTFVEAILSPEKSSLTNSAQAAITPGVVGTLPANIAYGVVVYDKASGLFVDQKTNNTNNPPTEFKLDGDKEYTFITYSLRNAGPLPALTNVGVGKNITDASLNNTNGDLLFDKTDFKVSGSVARNDVGIVLKHKTSRVTATLDGRQVGTINIQNAVVTPAKQNVGIKFTGPDDNGTITYAYGPDVSGGQAVPFTNNNAAQVNTGANWISVIAPSTDNGVMKFGTMRIDQTPTIDFTVPFPVKLQPGLRYNLDMKIKPCRQTVNNQPFDVRQRNGPIRTPGAIFTDQTVNAGVSYFVDFELLDSSFLIKVNGTDAVSKEIQFGAGEGYPQNIEFIDGTRYGAGGIPQIYAAQLVGGNPTVRVMISPDPNNPGQGVISIYGKKSTSSELIPMRLISSQGISWQTFTWNTSGNNSVQLRQNPNNFFGDSSFSGTAYGKAAIPCTP